MSSVFLAWHIVWFARVICSLALFLVVIRKRLYKPFPLFAVYAGWISLIGALLVAMNYSDFIDGGQYFAGVTASNAVATALAFAIIYRIFIKRLSDYPQLKDLGVSVFRGTTLVLLLAAVALAWLVPGQGPSPSITYIVTSRTVHILECGQLVFLALFSGYFRLPWRSRAFGIVLGLGILSSTSLAINTIHSQMAATAWTASEYAFLLVNDSTYLVAVVVWLYYLLAPERSPQSASSSLPPHDLDPWNQELERLLKP
jgi:hypothetical protein